MVSKKQKVQKNKGERKGWPTIKAAKSVKISDAKKAVLFNTLTGQNTDIKLSWK